MQNDLLWYKENDEDYVMPPLFDGRDFDGDPSEDKFVMSVQAEELVEDVTKYSITSEGRKRWALAPAEILKGELDKDCDELDENSQLEESDQKCEERCSDYRCSAPLCACCNSVGVVGLNHTYDFNSVEKESQLHEHDDYSLIDDGIVGESHDTEAVPDEEAGAMDDEPLSYENQDDYEIFNLTIIHRKNRLVKHI